jgi:excisionase family DNA binding protein
MTDTSTSPASIGEYRKVREIADELGVTPQHIRNLIKRGDIAPAYRVGNLLLLPKASVSDFMRRATVQTELAA